jgi:hypothetical protein
MLFTGHAEAASYRILPEPFNKGRVQVKHEIHGYLSIEGNDAEQTKGPETACCQDKSRSHSSSEMASFALPVVYRVISEMKRAVIFGGPSEKYR